MTTESHDWRLKGEVRPRFSSFHARLTLSPSFQLISVDPKGSEILLTGASQTYHLSFPENIQFSGKISYLREGPEPNEILLSLHTLDSNTVLGTEDKEFALLSSTIEDTSDDASSQYYPFSIESKEIEGRTLSIRCKKCNKESLSLVPSRVAPLPSSDWKEGAASWFCGCKQNPNKVIRLAEAIAGGVLCWTGTSIVIPDAPRESLECRNCHTPLGTYTKNAANIWLSSIDVTEGRSSILKASFSFVSFLREALRDSPTLLVPKVVFKGHEGGILCMRVMDTKLRIFEGSSERGIVSSEAFKVLYAEGKDLESEELNQWMRFDVRVSFMDVPEEILTLGHSLLDSNQAYGHPDDKLASGFKVSFVPIESLYE